MFKEHRIQLAEVGMNYAEGPSSGPPLVMLHGGSNRWQRWRSILPPLAERWRVYAPDLRGHGGSSWTPDDYSIRSFTDDIVAFLDRVIPERAVLFGHSLGAEIAVWTAARSLHRVRGLIVEDGPFTGAGAIPMIARQREHLAFQRRYAGSDVEPTELALLMPDLPLGRDGDGRPILARDVLGDGHPEYLEWAEMIRAQDPTFLDALSDYERFSAGYDLHLLSGIACPVLLLRAGNESALPIEEARTALDVMPDARLVTLEGVHHGMHSEAPQLVLGAVLPFLEEIR